MKYRPDIDGLRSIAVLSVILFHFGTPGMGGGYIGVDIFFVISGFLITGVIQKDQETGNFSFKNFYIRRVKRILPALYAMTSVTLGVGFIFLFPKEFEEFCKSAIAALFNAANILFWKKNGYFDLGNEYKPLLHTWSLAVEEQFYIGFPLFIFVFYRFARRSLFAATAFSAALSFALSVYLQEKSPSANFYLLPTRAWELACGALLVLYPGRIYLSRTAGTVITLIGLLCVFTPLFTYTEETVFPGLAAAPVCVGTALLILSGSQEATERPTFYHRLITLPPLLYIGKISYSLYLWHWPIFIFIYLIFGMSFFTVGAMFGLTFICGALSYHFIEAPYRIGKFTDRQILKHMAIWSLALIGFAAYGIFNKGLPNRFPAETKHAFSGQFNYDPDIRHCSENPAAALKPDACIIGDPKLGKPNILLWGDSHGRAYTRALKRAAEKKKVNFYARSIGGCIPGVGNFRSGRKLCQTYSATVLDFIEANDIKKVILIARWSFYRNGGEGRNRVKLYDDKGLIQKDALARKFDAAFEKTINALQERGVKLYLVHQGPSFDTHIPEYVARRYLWWDVRRKEANSSLTDRILYEKYNEKFERKYDVFLQEKNVTQIYPGDMLCPNPGPCLTEKDGYALYRDTNHLSVYGSEYVAPLFDRVFRDK